jgi:oxygen-independent coproporphyrinogen-3 oxidase
MTRQSPSPSGLYVHVPFCSRKCRYCDFYSVPYELEPHGQGRCGDRRDPAARYVDGVIREASRYQAWPYAFSTLYLGGGSPSLLPSKELARLVEGLRSLLPFASGIEATIELNPADVTEELTEKLLALGFCRFSLGVQSFCDEELSFLGRRHDASRARQAVRALRSAGAKNFGLDLIYGTALGEMEGSDETLSRWKRTLEDAVGCEPDHISCYELTLAPSTPLGRLAETGAKVKPEEEVCADLFFMAHELLSGAGHAGRKRYDHYEVSSYAKDGRRCLHNEQYWRRAPYLGLGPGAHSFDGRSERWWNEQSWESYLRALESGRNPPGERESIDSTEKLTELLGLGLRTAGGVLIEDIETAMGCDPGVAETVRRLCERVGRDLLIFEDGKEMEPGKTGEGDDEGESEPECECEGEGACGESERSRGLVRPTPRGMLFADHIAVELLDGLWGV